MKNSDEESVAIPRGTSDNVVMSDNTQAEPLHIGDTRGSDRSAEVNVKNRKPPYDTEPNMTVNDLVYKILARAKILADEKIDYLRRCVASAEAHSEHAIWMESRHKTRGELIEEILEEEFIEEFPREIVEN